MRKLTEAQWIKKYKFFADYKINDSVTLTLLHVERKWCVLQSINDRKRRAQDMQAKKGVLGMYPDYETAVETLEEREQFFKELYKQAIGE